METANATVERPPIDRDRRVPCTSLDPHVEAETLTLRFGPQGQPETVHVDHECGWTPTPAPPAKPRVGLQALFHTLKDGPDEARKIRERLWDAKDELERLDARLRLHEADLLDGITAAADAPTGKPRFPNESARKVQLARSLDADGPHQEVRRARRAKEAEIRRLDIALDWWSERQRNARTILLAGLALEEDAAKGGGA